MSDPCPDCGGPTIQVGVWGPPARFGPFCEACHPAPPPQPLPPGIPDGGYVTEDVVGVLGRPATKTFNIQMPEPAFTDPWDLMRRAVGPELLMMAPPADVERLRQAVADEGLALKVRVEPSEIVPAGEAVLVREDDWLIRPEESKEMR